MLFVNAHVNEDRGFLALTISEIQGPPAIKTCFFTKSRNLKAGLQCLVRVDFHVDTRSWLNRPRWFQKGRPRLSSTYRFRDTGAPQPWKTFFFTKSRNLKAGLQCLIGVDFHVNTRSGLSRPRWFQKWRRFLSSTYRFWDTGAPNRKKLASLPNRVI